MDFARILGRFLGRRPSLSISSRVWVDSASMVCVVLENQDGQETRLRLDRATSRQLRDCLDRADEIVEERETIRWGNDR